MKKSDRELGMDREINRWLLLLVGLATLFPAAAEAQEERAGRRHCAGSEGFTLMTPRL